METVGVILVTALDRRHGRRQGHSHDSRRAKAAVISSDREVGPSWGPTHPRAHRSRRAPRRGPSRPGRKGTTTVSRSALARPRRADCIADVAAFLCSDDARVITRRDRERSMAGSWRKGIALWGTQGYHIMKSAGSNRGTTGEAWWYATGNPRIRENERTGSSPPPHRPAGIAPLFEHAGAGVDSTCSTATSEEMASFRQSDKV